MINKISWCNVKSVDKTGKKNFKTEYLELVDSSLGISKLVRRVLFLFCPNCFDLPLWVLTLVYNGYFDTTPPHTTPMMIKDNKSPKYSKNNSTMCACFISAYTPPAIIIRLRKVSWVNGLCFQILCGGYGLWKAHKISYAYTGVSSNFVSSLWIIMNRND